MSSRDRPDKSGASRPPARQSERPEATPDTRWDIDPAEIDRYLSGRPPRSAGSSQSTQRQRTGSRPADTSASTSDQLAQLRHMVDPNRPVKQSPRTMSTQQTNAAPRPRPLPQQHAGSAQRQSTDRSSSAPTTGQSRQTASPSASASRANQTSRSQSNDAWDEREQLLRNDPYVTGAETGADDNYDEYGDNTGFYEDEVLDERPSGKRRGRTPSVPSIPKISMPAMPKIAVPQGISQAAIFSDVTSLSLIGISVVSLAAMAILVGNRIGTLPATIPTHVSASGLLEDVKSRSALWRLPLLAIILTLMNLVIALFVARIDRFASRFILGAALIVQFVAWVAVIRIL